MEKPHQQLDPSLKRKRGVVACVNCRARKVRCNVEGGIPCHNCITDKISCSIVQRKRRYPRPDWGSDTYDQEIKRDMACVSTPSSSCSTSFQCHDHSPAENENSGRRTPKTAVPQSPSSENDSTHSDQAIAKWLLSCPASLSSGLPDRLLGVITRASISEQARTPAQLSQRRAFQDCLKHIRDMIEYRPVTPITTPSSSSGNDYGQFSNDDVDRNHAVCTWPEDVQDLLRTCKNLIAISCRLSGMIFTSTASLNKQAKAEMPKEFSESEDAVPYFNDWLPQISPTAWDETDYTLPDELGITGFDCLLGMLNSEATPNQNWEQDT